LGKSYTATGKYASAATALERAEFKAKGERSDAPPRDIALIMVAFGDLYEKRGMKTQAASYYDQAMSYYPYGQIASNVAEKKDRLSVTAAKTEKPKVTAKKYPAKIKTDSTKSTGRITTYLDRSVLIYGETKIITPKKKKLSKEQEQQLKQCIEKAKDLYKKRELLESQNQYEICLQIQPTDIDSRISLAGILSLRNDYARAKQEFEISLKLMPSSFASAAYCHSRLGDIEVRYSNLVKAKYHYKKTLEFDPMDVNARVGLAKIYELEADKKQAWEEYKKILQISPKNVAAIQGRERLSPFFMTDEEILVDLKQRKAVDLNKMQLDINDKTIFYKIRQAEQMGAIKRLKKKFGRLYPSHVMQKRTEDAPLTLHLTYKGLQAYRKLISGDTIAILRKNAMPLKFLFMVRDRKGRVVFDRNTGLITYEGFGVYQKLMALEKDNKKITEKSPIIISNRPISMEVDEEGNRILSSQDKKARELEKKGFDEITAEEYVNIKNVTQCSEITLIQDLDMNVIKTSGVIRFFVDATGIRKDRGTLMSITNDFRKIRNPKSGPVYSSMFGMGSGKAKKICKKDGTLDMNFTRQRR
ncbi:MAG TPA: hypothetical protein VMW66_00235, partial [Elusimicrobiales bacterium]|nr:hypothetical protein [Elusimicrobiales bacterium]